MKIAVMGAGGVGAYFGGRLAAAGEEVHLIARGPHLAAIRERGVRVRSVAGDFEVKLHATDDPAEIGPCDHVLFCVKAYDTEDAASRLGPLLDGATAVVSLQNGIDNEDKLGAAIGPEHVLGGVAFIFSTIAESGVIVHSGGPGRILFGEIDGTASERAEALAKACRNAGIDATATDEIRRLLWDKLAFICAHSGVTAATRLPIGKIRDVPAAMGVFRSIVEEVRDVAAAEGVELSHDVVDRHEGFARSLEPETFSSLHHDLTHGRPMELEALQGEVVRRGHSHDVRVPVTETVYGLLSPWAVANAGEARR
jgi:2-dehydropantoate 2-reductase